NQRRRADGAALPARRALRTPGRKKRLEDLGRDRLLIELEPDLNREPPLLWRRGIRELSYHRPQVQMLDLTTIGARRERKSARRRQSGARERREVCRLRPDALGIGGVRRVERDDECAHGLRGCSTNCRPGRAKREPGPLSPQAACERWVPDRPFGPSGTTPTKSLHMVAVARQRIDDGDLLDREVGYDLDRILVHDQYLLDAHAVAEPLAVLRLERERHAFLDFDRMVERPDARDHRRIVLCQTKTMDPQIGGGLVLVLVAPGLHRRRPLERDVARGGAGLHRANRV